MPNSMKCGSAFTSCLVSGMNNSLLSSSCLFPCQAQAELLKQAFEKIGGEGVIPPLFDSSIGDIDLSFLTGVSYCMLMCTIVVLHSS